MRTCPTTVRHMCVGKSEMHLCPNLMVESCSAAQLPVAPTQLLEVSEHLLHLQAKAWQNISPQYTNSQMIQGSMPPVHPE